MHEPECTTKLFEVSLRFNSGNPYGYLSCFECDATYDGCTNSDYYPKRWPTFESAPDVYVVGVQ